MLAKFKEFFLEETYHNLSGIKSRACCVVIIIALVNFMLYVGKPSEWEKEYFGIPDVISSTSANSSYRLDVVANSNRVQDKEELARKIIHMCQDNSFHSTRFSVDLKGHPSKLNITVYLRKSDVEKGKAICQIRYEPLEFNPDYDIKNNVEKYHLYLDDNEIDFY